MRDSFFELMEANPVIAAIKDEKGLENCCTCEEIRVVFILYGDICSIGAIVERVKSAGKIAMVHMDLIDGLKGKESTVDFIKQFTTADGIISTKTQLIRQAKDLGLLTVQRFFALDSKGLESIEEMLRSSQPDLIEIVPGVIPKVLTRFAGGSTPVIAGGLFETKAELTTALGCGIIAVSTGQTSLWYM